MTNIQNHTKTLKKGGKNTTPKGKPKRTKGVSGKLVNKRDKEYRESKKSLYIYIFVNAESEEIEKIESVINDTDVSEPIVNINYKNLSKDTVYIGSTDYLTKRQSNHIYIRTKGSVLLAKLGIQYEVYYVELNLDLIEPSTRDLFHLDEIGTLTRDDLFYLEYLLINDFINKYGKKPLGNTDKDREFKDIPKGKKIKLRTLLKFSKWRKYNKYEHHKKLDEVTPEFIDQKIREYEQKSKGKNKANTKANSKARGNNIINLLSISYKNINL